MSNYNKKKAEQLGMSHGAARNRLVKSLLWDFVVKSKQNFCYHCGTEILTIHDLSIEHKEPWLDSEDPISLYFDLTNIAYSHLSCNCSAGKREKNPHECGNYIKHTRGCRCNKCKEAWNEYKRNNYSSEKRRERYLRTGS